MALSLLLLPWFLGATIAFNPGHHHCSNSLRVAPKSFRSSSSAVRLFDGEAAGIDIPDIDGASFMADDPTAHALTIAAKGITLLKDGLKKPNADKSKTKQPQPFWRRTKGHQPIDSSGASWWTRTRAMRRLSEWAFRICDVENTGRINKRSFYTGLLLVHLNLAKYAGVAACSPPSRKQVDELFILADQDRSGLLNQQEFTDAVVVSCARITSRVMIYWSLMLFVVPSIVRRTMTYVLVPLIHPSNQSLPLVRQALLTLEWVMQYAVALASFSVLVPQLFGRIDKCSNRLVKTRKNPTTWWETWGKKVKIIEDKGDTTTGKVKQT